MSEYWKSTPKYWCKFCQVYVRDTKIERQNHEATGRHQGNIQRSLRGLHRDHEREQREKQRAKDEVARLNGVVGGAQSPSAPSSGAPWQKSIAGGAPAPRQATADDRKRQMQQLADMGVAIPEEYRRDMALAGEWQTIAVTQASAKAGKGDGEDVRLDAGSIGVRKRKLAEDQDDSTAGHERPQWGSTKRTFATAKIENDDFDALLGGPITAIKAQASAENAPHAANEIAIKQEESDRGTQVAATDTKIEPKSSFKAEPIDMAVANETQASASGVVFKKRKKKP